jgi:protein SCO1/2
VFRRRRALTVVTVVVPLILVAEGVRADRKEPLPKQAEGVGIDEKLGAALPMDTPFLDETGREVRLGDFFQHNIPTILTLNYSSCPMLCSIQLSALVKALRSVDWTAGAQFQLLTVSLDPTETPARAKQSKDRYLGEYGRAAGEPGWHFLVGSKTSIDAVAHTVGFGYRYNPERQEYIHAAALVLLRPDGRVARYLYGITYAPRTLELSLRETADGQMVSTVDKLILYCFHFDNDSGRYTPVATNLMRLGGTVTLGLLGLVLGSFYWRDRRRRTPRSNPKADER